MIKIQLFPCSDTTHHVDTLWRKSIAVIYILINLMSRDTRDLPKCENANHFMPLKSGSTVDWFNDILIRMMKSTIITHSLRTGCLHDPKNQESGKNYCAITNCKACCSFSFIERIPLLEMDCNNVNDSSRSFLYFLFLKCLWSRRKKMLFVPQCREHIENYKRTGKDSKEILNE